MRTIRPGQRNILIIDDEKRVTQSLQALLTEEGFSASATYSGVEGLAWAKLNRPDAVICDILMPDIPGTEVAISIRRFLPQCRTLLMSAYFSTADMREYPWRQVLPFEVIAKPIDFQLLLNWLNNDLT
jgi:DNA-binding NtrC family response regulator